METSVFGSVIWAFTALFMAIQPGPHELALLPSPDLISVKQAALMPSALREDALLVTVNRDGAFFLGSLEAMPDYLASLIKTKLQQVAQRKVYLRVDGRTSYSDISIVLEEKKRTGLQDICFLAQ